jgi:hypothetical protein
MAITFTFLTDDTMQLEIAPVLGDLQNVVTRVRYNYVGVNEDGIEGIFAGATPMPLPEDTENYIPFAQLQPENIVAWLEAVSDKVHMQERITKQIEAQIAPKYEPVPSPWAPTTTSTTTLPIE